MDHARPRDDVAEAVVAVEYAETRRHAAQIGMARRREQSPLEAFRENRETRNALAGTPDLVAPHEDLGERLRFPLVRSGAHEKLAGHLGESMSVDPHTPGPR